MSTFTSLEHQSKRVILRLQVNNFRRRDSFEYNEAIEVYIAFAEHYVNELKEDKHYAYIELYQALELQQCSFHIILDIEKDLLNSPNIQKLPHEIYHVCRDKQGKL